MQLPSMFQAFKSVALAAILASSWHLPLGYAAGKPTPIPRPPSSVALLGTMAPVVMPKVLSGDDVQRYDSIFKLQESGEWGKADKLIDALDDKLLMGHVLAQRYLHPTKYRSKYKELKDWMEEYSDHHYAPQIYKLALRRRPANWKKPKPPAVGRNLTPPSAFESEAIAKPPEKRLNRAQRREVWRLKIRIRDRLRRGHTKEVKQMLDDKNLKSLFSDYDMDWSYARLAKGYFMDGRDEWAVQWAEKATKRSGKYLPEAHWTAGLALWRLGQYNRAGEHFEQASILDRSPWTHSASAFWAARAYMVARKPEKVAQLLAGAAEHERTFYGMLAGRLMGREIKFNWEIPPLAGDETRKLKGNKGGRRALALLQLGEDAMAERELRKVATLVSKDAAKDILTIAANAGMAELAMRLDAMLYPDGGGLDGAVYPVPAWQPEGGFKVDRALIYALVRQESRFNPNAKSGVGARGLMQLMPGTAGFVARDKRYRWSKKSALFDPEHNLALGQRYIQILLNDKKINGDLFLMAAAWNGGPGNLNKWRRRGNDLDDALFFIESLPSRETRIFIERVLTNLWVYRNRLGQPAPSLDAIARGEWPQYQSLGQRPLVVADVKN